MARDNNSTIGIKKTPMRRACRLSLAIGALLLLSLGLWSAAVASEATPSVGWRTLGQLNYKTGDYPDVLGQLNGSTVQIPGFAVPLEINGQNIKELALVPQLGMCIHVPPPPPNQMFYVKLKQSVSYEELWARPIWITGNFQIDSTESLYGAMGFTMFNATVRPYEVPKQ